MESNKKSGIYYVTGGFYILILFFMAIVTFFFNRTLAYAEAIICALLCIVNYVYKKYSEKRISDMFENMSLQIGSETRNALVRFPLPTLLVEKSGKIKWYNELFLCLTDQKLYDKSIDEIIPELPASMLFSEPYNPVMKTVTVGDRVFRVFGSNPIKNNKKGIIVLYFDDITDYADYKQKYIDEKTFECLLFIDNYDDLMESVGSAAVPGLQAELYRHINDWTTENGGVLVKYEKDKYCILFEHSKLEGFIQNKFEILSKIRSLTLEDGLPASISIGVGVGGADIVENDEFAKTAINIALGRGGDQAVIKDGDQFLYFGGNSKEYEKSTRVKARVVSFALSGLIKNADNIIIMSHKDTDIDALGASFGVYRMCRMHEKPANILLETYDQTVKNMLDRLEGTPEYEGLFLNSQQAGARITDSTLVVVVDTHKPSLLDTPALLDKAGEIVVIDHHRRGGEFIENTALIYHEPYASSASEMVTEVLQYCQNKMSLTKLEAECLYAGILVDTKYFTFKTGVRTFDAASFLKKQGVDTVVIKTMFQQDLHSYIKRAMIMKDAEIIHDNIAVSTYTEEEKNVHIIIAQAADELLNIKGITASFVLYKSDDGVKISGRSLGGINVQIILEKLGGGGHLTIAGAQLSDCSVEEAKEKLYAAIDEYYLETIN